MNMQTKIILTVVIVAAAAALAIAPLAALNAMAAPNGDTKTTCVHNDSYVYKNTRKVRV